MINPVPKIQLTKEKIFEFWEEEKDFLIFAEKIILYQKYLDATICKTLWQTTAGGMATEYECYGDECAQAIISGHNCK